MVDTYKVNEDTKQYNIDGNSKKQRRNGGYKVNETAVCNNITINASAQSLINKMQIMGNEDGNLRASAIT